MSPARLAILQRELSELAVSLDLARRRLVATERVIAEQRTRIEALLERVSAQGRRRATTRRGE